MTRVKICGVTEAAHAIAAAEAGADFVGVVFAGSPRRVSLAQARAIASAVRASGSSFPKLVGVFANDPLEDVAAAVEAVPLDMTQLSGDEPLEYLEQTPKPAIRAVHLTPGQPGPEALSTGRRGLAALKGTGALPLLDAKAGGRYGGTGLALDRAVVRELALETDFLLAGGLTPENVAHVVAEVRPWGVDVSSGVETNGRKDAAKIRAFVAAVRGAAGSR